MPSPLLPFLSFIIAANFTPGPNNLTSMTLGMQGKYKKAFPFIIGVFCGMVLLLFITGLLKMQIEELFFRFIIVFKVLGTAYLLWMAISLLFTKKEIKKSNEGGSFVKGFFLQIINPKALFFTITIYSLFFTSPNMNIINLLAISLGLSFVTVAATSTWALSGTFLSERLKNPIARKIFYVVMGLLLIYTALSIVLTEF